MIRQLHILYSGRVQGVSFRYTTREIARDLGVSGWAMNLRDGRVEVVAEAEEHILELFLGNISKAFNGYIRHRDMHEHEASGEFNGFEIRF